MKSPALVLAALVGLSLSGAASILAAAEAPASAKPNVVLILADDLGFGDLGCYGGHAIPTPNIDRVAAQGRRFVQAYAPSATCTPSRYALLTGEYPWRQRDRKTSILAGDDPLAIKPGTETLATVFHHAGYSTAVVGKWHLGLGDGSKPIDFNGAIAPGPCQLGFDQAFFIPATLDRVPTVLIEGDRVQGLDPADPIHVSYQSQIGHDPTGLDRPDLLRQPADRQHSGTIVNGISRIGWMSGGNAARWVDETLAAKLVERSARFIEENRTHPFFLYFASLDPHVPRSPNPRFAGASKLGPRGDAIVQLDWTVGQVMAALAKAGVADRTLVIITSDNGPVLFDGYFDQAVELNGAHRPAGGLRGWKYLVYEGGCRVPFIARWPGHIPVGDDNRMLCLTDVMATAAAITGQSLARGAAVDSVDQLAVLSRADGPALRTEVVEQGVSDAIALRQGPWKFIRSNARSSRSGLGGAEGSDRRWTESIIPADALYDLTADPAEQINLANRDPERARSMRARLEQIEHSSP
jgi:arylsulfatase A-like enzyme